MKHILLISQYFHPERFRVNDLAFQLVQRGYKVTVLTGIPNYPEGRFFKGYNWFKRRKERLNGISIIRLPIFSRGKNKIKLILNYFSFSFLGSLFVIFTRNKFDLVFTYGISPILQAIPGIIYSNRKKIKSYLYLMDLWPFSIVAVDGIKNKLLFNFISKISKWIYKKSSLILISSKGYKEDLISMGIENKKIIYWPQYHEEFYVPLERNFSATPELIPHKFNFIFTGNMGAGQGIIFFLEFINEYKKELNKLNLMFNFMGDGKERNNLINFVLNNKIDHLVRFIQPIKAQDVPQYLSNSNGALLLMGKHPHLSKVLPAKVPSYVGCKVPIFAIVNNPLGSFIVENNYGLATDNYVFANIYNKLLFFVGNFNEIKNKVTLSFDHFKPNLLMDELVKLF